MTREPSASVSVTLNALLASALLAALAGALGGSLAALLLLTLDGLQHWLWGISVLEGLPTKRPGLWCLLIPIATGLALCLLQWRQPQALLPEFSKNLSSLRSPAVGVPGTDILPLLGGTLALIAGGSLGPEALVTHLVVQTSRRLWHGQDQRLVQAALSGSLALFHTPLAGP